MSTPGFTGDLVLEAAAFGQALLTGAALGLYYDLYRILRRLFPFGYAMIAVQDVIFWITGAIGVFFASVVVSGGQLRIFFVLTALVGWAIYAATVGSVLMAVVDVVLKLFGRLWSLLTRLTRPFTSRVKAALSRLISPVKAFCLQTLQKFSKKTKITG